MELVELQEGTNLQEVRKKTEAYYTVSPNIFGVLIETDGCFKIEIDY